MRFARLVAPDIRTLLDTDPEELRDALGEFHPVDLGEVLAQFDPEVAARIVRLVPEPHRAQVFEYVPEDLQVRIVTALSPGEAANLLEEMAPDERVDLVAELSDLTRSQVIPLMGKEEAQETQALAAYPENTAGGRMTTEFVRLSEELTADEAIAHVRAVAAQKETIYYGYVLGPAAELRGVVSLAKLVMARPTDRLTELMEPRIVRVLVDADQEDVARVLSKYDLLAVPVVDAQERMLGIVTVDDVLDVVREEETEDIHRLGAVAPIAEPYLRAAFFDLLRKRAVWLVLIFVGATLTGTALRQYEGLFQAVPELVLFLPLLISSGGNSGSQSSTLVIRALALGEVSLAQWWVVLWRELRMGIALGLILGAVGCLRAYFWDTPPEVILTIGFSVIGIVLWGNLVGAALPLLLRTLHLDPAFASGAFVATFVDVSGILIYMGVALALIPTL
jgi:magnesium transporter